MAEKYSAIISAGRKVACVFHVPFGPAVAPIVRSVGGRAADFASLDTMIMIPSETNPEMHVGRWSTNFGRDRLALMLNRSNEGCCVCFEGTKGFLCGVCKTKTCGTCARNIGSAEYVNGRITPLFQVGKRMAMVLCVSRSMNPCNMGLVYTISLKRSCSLGKEPGRLLR